MALVRRNLDETEITSANDDTFAEASKGYRCRSGAMSWVVGCKPNRDWSQISKGTSAGNVSRQLRGFVLGNVTAAIDVSAVPVVYRGQ